MIYVSSSCSKQKDIAASIKEIAEFGFFNIELSGGTEYYKGYVEDIINLKRKYNLNILLHNYFPPSEENFVLNLASHNEDIFNKSFEHCKSAIALSKKLGCNKYGIHAGFFIDIKLSEVGKKLNVDNMFNKDSAIKRFCKAYNKLKEIAENDVELYLENNVISHSNYVSYNNTNPFMLTDYNSYLELKEYTDFRLLFDVGHLKVSCRSLNYNFEEHLEKMIAATDYIHISDNDGLHDQNKAFNSESDIIRILKKYNLSDKIITLEVYESSKKIKESFETIKQIKNAG